MSIRIRISAVIVAMLALLLGAAGQASAFNQNLLADEICVAGSAEYGLGRFLRSLGRCAATLSAT